VLRLTEDAGIQAKLAELLGKRYQLRGQLGAGGFALVYHAWDAQLERPVAVKVLRPAMAALEPVAVARFEREAQTLARLDHPNVVPVFDAGEHDGLWYIIMPLVEGGSLEAELRRVGCIEQVEAVRLMTQTASGLKAAHDRGVVHRDVKPANILLHGPERRVLLTDFGIAKSLAALAQTTLTARDTGLGTFDYIAPEQAEDSRSVDLRADIYAFGATFYHVLTGRPPFQGDNYLAVLIKHKTEAPASPRAVNPGLDPWISDLLERCLAKSPSDRFQTSDEVLVQLGAGADARPWEHSDDAATAPFLDRYRTRRTMYLQAASLNQEDEYVFPNARRLVVLAGDITDQAVDAIVSSDDESVSMSGGVSGRIRIAGGASIAQEAFRYVAAGTLYPLAERPARYVLPAHGVRPGRAVVTSAGTLKARFVFHGVTLGAEAGEWVEPSRDLITEIMESCFYHADTLRLRSLAFPLLATGAGRFPKDVCLDTMFRFLVRKLLRGVTTVSDVRLVLFVPRSH